MRAYGKQVEMVIRFYGGFVVLKDTVSVARDLCQKEPLGFFWHKSRVLQSVLGKFCPKRPESKFLTLTMKPTLLPHTFVQEAPPLLI